MRSMRANDGPRDACIASWVPVAYGTAATSPLAVFLEFREFRHKRRTKCGQHEGSLSSSRFGSLHWGAEWEEQQAGFFSLPR